MPRPKKAEGRKFQRHQMTFPPELWADFADLLLPGETASGVIQRLVGEWVRDRKAEKAGEGFEDLAARVARLEGKRE